jgi:hypothetical protein
VSDPLGDPIIRSNFVRRRGESVPGHGVLRALRMSLLTTEDIHKMLHINTMDKNTSVTSPFRGATCCQPLGRIRARIRARIFGDLTGPENQTK